MKLGFIFYKDKRWRNDNVQRLCTHEAQINYAGNRRMKFFSTRFVL